MSPLLLQSMQVEGRYIVSAPASPKLLCARGQGLAVREFAVKHGRLRTLTRQFNLLSGGASRRWLTQHLGIAADGNGLARDRAATRAGQ